MFIFVFCCCCCCCCCCFLHSFSLRVFFKQRKHLFELSKKSLRAMRYFLTFIWLMILITKLTHSLLQIMWYMKTCTRTGFNIIMKSNLTLTITVTFKMSLWFGGIRLRYGAIFTSSNCIICQFEGSCNILDLISEVSANIQFENVGWFLKHILTLQQNFLKPVGSLSVNFFFIFSNSFMWAATYCWLPYVFFNKSKSSK